MAEEITIKPIDVDFIDSRSVERIVPTPDTDFLVQQSDYIPEPKFVNLKQLTISVNTNVVESSTYDEIMSLASQGLLIPGGKYEITDFQTMYLSNKGTYGSLAIGIGEYRETIFNGFNGNLILGDGIHLGVDNLPHPSVVYCLELIAKDTHSFEFEARISKPNSLMPDPSRFKIWYNPTSHRDFFGPNHKGTIFRMDVPDRNVSVCFDFMNQIWWRPADLLNLYGIQATEGRYFSTFNLFEGGTIIQASIDYLDKVRLLSNFGVDDPFTDPTAYKVIRCGSTALLSLTHGYGRYNCGCNVFIGSGPSHTTSGNYMAFSDIEFGPGSYDNTLISMSTTWSDIWGIKFGNLCRHHILVAQNTTAGLGKINFGFHIGGGITMIGKNVAAINIRNWSNYGKFVSNGDITGIDTRIIFSVIKSGGSIVSLNMDDIRYSYVSVAGDITRVRMGTVWGTDAVTNPIVITEGSFVDSVIEKMRNNSSLKCSNLTYSNIGILYNTQINGNTSLLHSLLNATVINLNLQTASLQNIDVSGFYAANTLTIKGWFDGELIMRTRLDNTHPETLDLDLYSDMGNPGKKIFSYIGQTPSGNSRLLCEYFDLNTYKVESKVIDCYPTI